MLARCMSSSGLSEQSDEVFQENMWRLDRWNIFMLEIAVYLISWFGVAGAKQIFVNERLKAT